MIDLQAPPPTITVPEAAELLGCSSSALYEAIRDGDAPVKVLRVGRAIRIPTAPLLAELGITGSATPTGPHLQAVGE